MNKGRDNMFINCTENCIFQFDGECKKTDCGLESSVFLTEECVYKITKKSSEAHKRNVQTPNQHPYISF